MHHDARAEHENLVPEIVAAEEFGTGELVGDIKPDGQVGECGKTRNGIRNARFDHECDKAERTARDFQEVRVERLRDAVEECGEGGKDHCKRNQFNAFCFEVEQCDAHDHGIRNRVQEFRDKEAFPEFSADEVPVEKCMLEHEPKCENQFAVKNRMVVAERERECDHEESCCHG